MRSTEEKKGSIKNSVGRLIFVVLSIVAQVWIIVELNLKLHQYYALTSVIMSVLALILALRVYGKHMNSAYKMSWMFLILVFPVFGVCMYLLFGNEGMNAITRHRTGALWNDIWPQLPDNHHVAEELKTLNRGLYNQFYYVKNTVHYPIYDQTEVTYYGDTNEALAAQIEALSSAKKYIFMEYFAIEYSRAWGMIEPILSKKAAEGVDVRILYDDVGSIGFINKDFVKHLESLGIHCQIFNPIVPFLTVIQNHRDHRKITVVDGLVGFTGGYNMADEYFNITHPYGQWKDSGIRLRGKAVQSLTAIFLDLWDGMHHQSTNLSDYLPSSQEFDELSISAEGYVMPYADTPMDDVEVGENVYLNMIKNAKEYLYITTPYLIIDDEMRNEFILAAGRGVDVRIVTPGIPDKKVIFSATRSYYSSLAKAGVKIYEYTPGFIHSKQMLADDEIAAVGTINLDYRSLYLHFEDGCLFTSESAIQAVKKDFEELFLVSTEAGMQFAKKRNVLGRIWRCILRLLSPLL